MDRSSYNQNESYIVATKFNLYFKQNIQDYLLQNQADAIKINLDKFEDWFNESQPAYKALSIYTGIAFAFGSDAALFLLLIS